MKALRDKALVCPGLYIAMGLATLGVDILTSPFLQFPVLFVIPVMLSAWYCGLATSFSLAVGLPLLRLAFHDHVELPHPLAYAVINAFIRAVVLGTLAYFVHRCARQAADLKERVSGLVTLCAWSRTVEYQGEWLSFEDYLKRRFGLDTSHGISPDEATKALAALQKQTPPAQDWK